MKIRKTFDIPEPELKHGIPSVLEWDGIVTDEKVLSHINGNVFKKYFSKKSGVTIITYNGVNYIKFGGNCLCGHPSYCRCGTWFSFNDTDTYKSRIMFLMNVYAQKAYMRSGKINHFRLVVDMLLAYGYALEI